jgi:hypothetical protein
MPLVKGVLEDGYIRARASAAFSLGAVAFGGIRVTKRERDKNRGSYWELAGVKSNSPVRIMRDSYATLVAVGNPLVSKPGTENWR